MKIVADFVTNSSEADYCDCSDCSNYCNCFCRQCVCSQCRNYKNDKTARITNKRSLFPKGANGTLLFNQWKADLKNCQ